MYFVMCGIRMEYVTNRLLNSCVISTIDVAAIFSFSLYIDSVTELPRRRGKMIAAQYMSLTRNG